MRMWTDEEAGRMNKIRNWLSKYSVELMAGIFLLYSVYINRADNIYSYVKAWYVIDYSYGFGSFLSFRQVSENFPVPQNYRFFTVHYRLRRRENVAFSVIHAAQQAVDAFRSWAIYMGERESGITWHYVNAGIDEGSIIIQKRCEIGPDTKAYELAEQSVPFETKSYCWR